MKQTGGQWLRKIGERVSIIVPMILLAWLLFVYGFGNSYEESTIRMLWAILAGIVANAAFWLVERLWAHWRAQ